MSNSTIVDLTTVWAAGSTPTYAGQIVDGNGVGLGAGDLNTLTLSIIDTARGLIINDAYEVNILNTGRGTIDADGNLLVRLLAGDTSMLEWPQQTVIKRSLVIDWTFNGGVSVGRHQVNFRINSLVGEPE